MLANPYKKPVSVANEDDLMADIFTEVGKAPRSPSPPPRKRKAPVPGPGPTSHALPPPHHPRGGYRNGASTSASASSALATSSDPILAGDSSFIETGPSSDGYDSHFTPNGKGDLSDRSTKKPRFNGTEDRIGSLNIDSSFDGGHDFDMPDYDNVGEAGAEEGPRARSATKLEGDAAAGQVEEDGGDEEDDAGMVLKAVRKKAKPSTAGTAQKRQLINSSSVKAYRPPSASAVKTEDDGTMKPADIKPVKTLQDAKKVKGMDWQLAAAAVTLDTDVEDAHPSSSGADGSDIFSSAGPATVAKTKKLKAPSAGGVPFESAKVQALEEDKSMRFFWLDYVETNGVLHFIGKVFDRESKRYVSCCMTVENIDRNLFVLPRSAGVDGEGRQSLAESYHRLEPKMEAG